MKPMHEENPAGNLDMELSEIKKLFRDDNKEEVVYATSTFTCSHFLTLYCC